MSSLIRNVVEFFNVLRVAGVRVSISESIDAINALEHINLLSKDEVKISLSACLAKSEEEKKIFSEAFNRFFIDSEERCSHILEQTKEIEQKRQEIVEAVSELKFQGEQIDLENELKEVYASISEEEKQSIKDFLNKTSQGKNVKSSFKPIVENILKSKLNNIKSSLTGSEGSLPENLWGVPSEAGIIAKEVLDTVREKESLLHKNIAGLSDADAVEAIRLIKKIAEGLKKNISRRYKKTSKKARLDLKKTIRSNLSTGYVQFRLRYKSRPRRKDKFLILCDVSSSMFRFSGFVLQFLISMHSSTSYMDSFIFSEEAEHLNMGNFINEISFERQIMESPVWRKGTNINKVLDHIFNRKDIILNSSTVVILVSDAKTLDAAGAAQKLKRLESKVKRVLWLNPVPDNNWAGIAGIDGFKKYSTMFDCSTLEKLAKACRNF